MLWFYLILSLLTGVLLGAFFWGGLWWTVLRITVSDRPYLIAAASFIVRTAVSMAAFFLLLTAGWYHLLSGLTGFLMARFILIFRLKPEQRHDLKGGSSIN